MAKILINIPQKQAFIYAFFLVLYEFATYIANDMIMPGMINVVRGFDGVESDIATSLTMYVLGGASLQLFLGPISDRYGRRLVMILGASLFFVCTVLIACSDSMSQFLVARYFQGMGLCFIGVIGYATLQEIFSEMDAIRLIAIMANVAILAPLIGPLFGAVIIYYYSWRIIFVLIGILAVLALWGLWRFMPEPVGQVNSERGFIQPVSLSPSVIWRNYKKMLLNPSFVFGAIAMGLLYLPCMAWIALSPIMLIKNAHLTVIQYALWQIPVFSAYIFGNIVLHYLTHRGTVKKLILIGSYITVFSLIGMYILTNRLGAYFLWFMPGLIVYFFGASICAAPLSRLILFSTHVSKGTASALMSMISMFIQAVGIEIANVIYITHNNTYFSDYCGLTSLLYALFLIGCLWFYKDSQSI